MCRSLEDERTSKLADLAGLNVILGALHLDPDNIVGTSVEDKYVYAIIPRVGSDTNAVAKVTKYFRDNILVLPRMHIQSICS